MSSTATVLSFNPATFRIVPLVLNSEQCDPLDFAVSKYNNDFLFATIEGIPGVPDPEVGLISELRVLVVGDASGNTECQNFPRFSDDIDVYERCMHTQIIFLSNSYLFLIHYILFWFRRNHDKFRWTRGHSSVHRLGGTKRNRNFRSVNLE